MEYEVILYQLGALLILSYNVIFSLFSKGKDLTGIMKKKKQFQFLSFLFNGYKLF